MRRRDARGELINECACKAARIGLRRRVLEARDGRLRGERRSGLGATADRHLQCRIVAQQVMIDRIFPAAANAEHARADDLGQAVTNARLVAPVRQCGRQPRDDADLRLGGPEQQDARIGRLVAAVEIDCEFLSPHGWQIEG